jgi:hypothetical protein
MDADLENWRVNKTSVVCENHFKLTDMTGTERKRLIATAKPLSAHDVYFENNTSLEILDDVEINSSNASDLIMIHDLEDLKVNLEMKIGKTLKELIWFLGTGGHKIILFTMDLEKMRVKASIHIDSNLSLSIFHQDSSIISSFNIDK